MEFHHFASATQPEQELLVLSQRVSLLTHLDLLISAIGARIALETFEAHAPSGEVGYTCPIRDLSSFNR